jgi:lysyl-tRNA synthetase, class II
VSIPFIEENDQTRARREHLEALRALVGNVYPNRFERSRVTGSEDTISALAGEDTIKRVVAAEAFGELFASIRRKAGAGEKPAPEELEAVNAELNKIEVRIAGRIATPPRVMGKAAFVHLSDGLERLQIYVRKADVRGLRNGAPSFMDELATTDESDSTGSDEHYVDGWQLFNLLDHGDFIGVAGYLFVTRTGELSVHVRELQFLAKALLPMPDKMHGISDPEIRQRQRYADLISGSLKVKTDDESEDKEELTPREVFQRRSRLITEMRRFLDDHGYVEVETPMLTPLATGAAAKPFKTHHNALDIDLYARIAPELYLKRLLVGGFEKVYELNRNFRNEGIGYRWNPEFTMLEFYCAYMDVNGMMDFCEELIRSSAFTVMGHTHARWGEHEIDFSQRFERLTMKEAIGKYWPKGGAITDPFPVDFSVMTRGRFNVSWLDDPNQVRYLAAMCNDMSTLDFFLLNHPPDWNVAGRQGQPVYRAKESPDTAEKITQAFTDEVNKDSDEPEEVKTDRMIVNIFETIVEPQLNQPTFITDFPKAVSPLSKASPSDSTVAERFELFIGRMEIANGFSELNDPVEQRERFLEQTQQRERGDEEAMVMDEDYIRALSYGMPPAAGIGIGIDRLTMILTGKRSIRDVILFPHMRPERKAEATTEEAQEQDNSA